MNVIWTKTSELTLDEIINYIENKFGILVSENIILMLFLLWKT